VGDIIAEYERQFATRLRAPHALAFTTARTALATVLRAAGLVPGDEVVLSPLTCKVVPLALLGAGLRPVYVDIRSDSLNLDDLQVPPAVTSRTRAILFQRTYGGDAGATSAARVAREHNLFFMEDCAQCMPRESAWCGDAAVFSNNAGKPLPAGSGGMAIVRDAALAAEVGRMREALPRTTTRQALPSVAEAWLRDRVLTPGLYWPAFDFHRRRSPSYRVRPLAEEIASEFTAASARISVTHARAGLRWLARAESVIQHRAACVRMYADLLHDMPGPAPLTAVASPLYMFPVLSPRKAALLEEAARRRVEIVAWPITTPIFPVTDAAALAQYGYVPGTCPVAEQAAMSLVGLPTHRLVRPRHCRAAAALVRQFAGGPA